MSDREKIIALIEELRRTHEIPPDLMAAIHRLVGLVAYSDKVKGRD